MRRGGGEGQNGEGRFGWIGRERRGEENERKKNEGKKTNKNKRCVQVLGSMRNCIVRQPRLGRDGGRSRGGFRDVLSYWTRRAPRCFHLCGGAGTRSGWIGTEGEVGSGGAG